MQQHLPAARGAARARRLQQQVLAVLVHAGAAVLLLHQQKSQQLQGLLRSLQQKMMTRWLQLQLLLRQSWQSSQRMLQCRKQQRRCQLYYLQQHLQQQAGARAAESLAQLASALLQLQLAKVRRWPSQQGLHAALAAGAAAQLLLQQQEQAVRRLLVQQQVQQRRSLLGVAVGAGRQRQ
jgi:hypothetical protein